MSEKFKNVALTKRGAGLPGSQQMADPLLPENQRRKHNAISKKSSFDVDERYNQWTAS
jgi:hypothetical protein